MDDASDIGFREDQRFRQWWVLALVLCITAIGWYGFIRQIVLGEPWGDRLAPDWVIWLCFLLVGIGLPALIFLARLTVTVDATHLRIRWFPFAWKTIALDDIESAESRTYRPLREYGGWGVRWMPGRGTAWNASGNRGVRLVLTNGKRVLVGSQRPDELAAAILSAR